MLLTLRAQYSAGVTPRAAADAVISALTPAAWYRNATDVVSSGGFASIWADYASTATGLVLPGVAGNYASAPYIAAYGITGDIELIARVKFNDWVNGFTQAIFGTLNAGATGGFQIRNSSTGMLVIAWGNGASFITVNSTAAPTISDGETLWVKANLDVDNGAGGYDAKFYTAADSETVPTSWTQLGATVTGGTTTALAESSAALKLGFLDVTGASLAGMLYRAIIKSGIGGTTVFDADFSAQAIGTASFTESSSNAATVTINTSGASPAHIGKARDLLQGTGTNQPAYAAGVFTFDGADNVMVASSWSQTQPTTAVIVFKQITWTANDRVCEGTTAAGLIIYQFTATPNLALFCGGNVSTDPDLALDTYGIIAAVANGASSSIRLNNNAAVTGNAGATNMGGFVLGARYDALFNWSNIAVQEVVIFPSALSDANQSAVITALNNALTVF